MRDVQEPDGNQGYAGHTELDGYDVEYGDRNGDEAGAPRRSGARKAVLAAVGGVSAALLAVGGYGLHNVVTAVQGGSSNGGSGGGAQASETAAKTPQAPPTAEEAAAVAKDFLAAWGRGDVTAASALTNRPETARAALAAFQENVPPARSR